MPIPHGSRPGDPPHDTDAGCWLLCCTSGRVPLPQESGGGFLPEGRFCFLFLPQGCDKDMLGSACSADGGHLFFLHSDTLPQELRPREGGIRSGDLSETLMACMEGLRSFSQMPSPTGELLMRVMVSEFAAAVLPVSDREENALPLGKRVMNYIDAHPAQSLSLDALARRFFVSKFYLCRSFRAYAGESLHSYRTRRRVEAACRLMAAGDTAASAAWKTGFSDYSTFYRACRKLYGSAPTRLPARQDGAADRTIMKGRSTR